MTQTWYHPKTFPAPRQDALFTFSLNQFTNYTDALIMYIFSIFPVTHTQIFGMHSTISQFVYGMRSRNPHLSMP